MESTLTDFVRVLRNAEIRVSPAETMDAARALELVGYADRERVRQVLAATLAKTIDEKTLFDECFERFFAWRRPDADVPALEGAERPAAPMQVEAAAASAASASTAQGAAAGELSELAELLLSGDAVRLAVAVDAAGRAAGIGEMRVFTQRGLYSRRILEQMGWQQLQSEILNLEQARPDADPGRAAGLALKRSSEMLRDRVREYVEDQYLMFASANARELRESVLRSARLSHLERRDLEQINRLVRRIARKLSARYSRRRRSFRRGLLDVPRTLRAGAAHDGLLFEPAWKSVRKDRPALIAICDISGSVRAYARFLLLFLYSLSDVLPRVRSFVFSSQLAEVTPLFEQNAPEVAVEIAQRQYGGGSTDYAAAIRGVLAAAGRELDRGATVVMLGDGRNNRGDPALEELREIGRRARQLIWLNPESMSVWGTGDSEMLRYRSCCSEARVVQSIQQLERFADDLLRKAM
jgi:uncharacterized protein with von Willebrand factor type A (vWA) domain